MKKLILIVVVFISFYSNAQCDLNFKDILSSTLLNPTEFDTFALNKGFDYNSDLKKYVCKSNTGKYIFDNVIQLSQEENKITVTYLTHSKDIYLLNKSQIENNGFEFIGNKIVNNMNVFGYRDKNINATLMTETVNDVINYYISIQVKLIE